MSLTPMMAHAMPFGVGEVFLQWIVGNVTRQTGSLAFDVQVSGVAHGDWEDLASNVTDFSYIHTLREPKNLLSINRSLVYRVGVTADGDESGKIWSNPIDLSGATTWTVEGHPNYGLDAHRDAQFSRRPSDAFFPQHGRDVRVQQITNMRMRRHARLRENYVGDRVAILKRRRFGTRCPDCWSPHAKGPVMTCTRCYATGWLGGYHTPLVMHVRIKEPGPTQQTRNDAGRTSAKGAQVSLLAFPMLERDDVIVELDNQRRWIVSMRDARILHSARYKQTVDVAEIARSKVEHTIPVTLDQAHVLRVQTER